MCSDVTGTICLDFDTGSDDNRCNFSDVTGTIAEVSMTSEAGIDVTGVCVVTSQGQ